jgi:gamma-glutamyltranspeptidase/glutathione hydrolase
MQDDGGLITHADLASYKSIVRKPLHGRYRGHDVLSMPPSSSGGVALLQMLSMLESRKLHIPAGEDAATAHYMIESMRRVFADRAMFLGDPAFYDVPVTRLLSREYCDSLYASIDAGHATPSDEIRRSMLPPREGEQTTHYSIIDRWGNAVSVTTTLNSSYGSMYVVPGTGFLLNNEMDDFSARPGVPNQFGLLGGEANSIQPGKRMLSSMTPAIVTRDGRVVMITGSPGGSTIITTVLHSICNLIDGGMRVDDVVAASRFHHQWYPDVVRYERGALNGVTLQTLTDMGHAFQEVPAIGRCDAIIAYPEKGVVEGCSDPRGYGAAAAE